jgi:hypothetical protein
MEKRCCGKNMLGLRIGLLYITFYFLVGPQSVPKKKAEEKIEIKKDE